MRNAGRSAPPQENREQRRGNIPDGRLRTADELAEHYGVCRATIYNLMRLGLPSLRIGSARRFRLDECDAWLVANQSAKAVSPDAGHAA